MVRAQRDPVLLVSGLVAVLGNVLAVVFLADIPGAYRLAELDRWATGVLASPRAATASAIAFTIGLFALAIWALALAERIPGPVARAGGWLGAIGSIGNGVGTVTPLVLALHVREAGPIARALLGITLSLDAAFNLTFGVGLILLSVAWARAPRLRVLGILAGVASLPVAAQAIVDPAASLLVVSGPLWLAFVMITGLRRWGDDEHA